MMLATSRSRDSENWASNFHGDFFGQRVTTCERWAQSNPRAFARFRRSTALASAAAQQPAQSPHDENQYRNRDNCQRQKVVNGIGENVIRVSRIEAIEAFKGGWQRC